jgi:rod shape-determining protein MreC
MSNAWRLISHWLGYVVLILAACAAMLLGKADAVLAERLRLVIAEAVAPMLEIVSRPLAATTDAFEAARHWMSVGEQNAALRREQEHLLQWQAVAQRLAEENAHLRALLSVAAEPDAKYVTARVLADPGGAFAHSLLITAGTDDGVAEGHIVVSSEGLVGRVASASERIARALLISDLNSRVPVVVGPGRLRAILAGDNSRTPRLIHLDPGASVREGDRVVTSGVTGAFPPGLPVGSVVSVSDRSARVVLLAQASRLEFVRVIDHRLPSRIERFLRDTSGTNAQRFAGPR